MREVAGSRGGVRELGDVRAPPAAFKRATPLQTFGKREDVDGLAAIGEITHRLEDQLVLLGIKRVGTDGIGDVVDGVRLEEERTEKPAFAVETLGRDAGEIG